MSAAQKYFYASQSRWITDDSPLKVCEKGRQTGFTYGQSYRAVKLVGNKLAKIPMFIVSRDMFQAKLTVRMCSHWAKVLNYAAADLGEIMFDPSKGITAFELRFDNGLSIYCLSSSPDAIAGKTGHVVLDEFALHKDQRELYRIAKPATQWGGTLSIISTHRGVATVFNEIVRGIKEQGNPMGWSLHTVPIQKSVDEGIVEKINAASGRTESREAFLERLHRECIDEEQWLQEYCCIPSDESSAFISYELIAGCEDASARKDYEYLLDAKNPLFVGVDIGRTKDLTVIDVEERIGDVLWERHRIEMANKTFAEQEFELYRILKLPQVRRCCIDSSGLGKQMAERAQERFRHKVEPVTFTQQVKQDLAYPLKAAHEDHTLRYSADDRLRADLRGIKKEITAAGNERFVGESVDSHCDRFWAKALAIHAGKPVTVYSATLI